MRGECAAAVATETDILFDPNSSTMHATTIILVRKNGKTVIAGDGQVSLGQTIIKGNARKVRQTRQRPGHHRLRRRDGGRVHAERAAGIKLEQYPGQLLRACVELAKDWRTDRYLRRLEAMMLVADKTSALVLTGSGDVLEPEQHGQGAVMGIGSGGNYALAAGRALLDTDLDAETIARRALLIAAEICVYTNTNVVVESLNSL